MDSTVDVYGQAFADQMRAQLVEQRDHLIRQNRDTLHNLMDQERVRGDSLDESTQEQNTSTQLRFRDRESLLLHKINDAIERLDDNIYGECESCGVWIGQRRLQARPTATLCIDCKEEEEQQQKRYQYRQGVFDDM